MELVCQFLQLNKVWENNYDSRKKELREMLYKKGTKKKALTVSIGKCLNLLGDPKGTRTPVPGVRGRCPRPLDDGAIKVPRYY